MPRPFTWALWTVALWTSGWGLTLQQNPLDVLYPALLGNQSIDCSCGDFHCDSVSWFRLTVGGAEVQFLGRSNYANRQNYGDQVDRNKFQFSSKSSAAFTLTVFGLTTEDTGTYACFMAGRKSGEEKWKSGVLLLPGVPPPTPSPPTTTKKKIESACDCSEKRAQGCGSLILWPLVGLVAAIAVALVCTLYYFSRLPKKCRHHFTKKRFQEDFSRR